MKKKDSIEKTSLPNDDQNRLELLNLAVLFRSAMIGQDEFEQQARSLGYDQSADALLSDMPFEPCG